MKRLSRYQTVAATVVITALGASSPSQAQQAAPPDNPEVELQYEDEMGVDNTLAVIQQEPDNVEMVHYLGRLYTETGDPRIVEELVRLVRESDNPDVREAAAFNLQREPERPEAEAAAVPGKAAADLSAAPVAPLGVPSDIDAVRVECNGECGDNTLGQLCANHTDTPTPIAVSCNNAQDAIGSIAFCSLSGTDNRCDGVVFNTGTRLDELCDDTSGWDAIVYCARN